ncbi:Hypothetical protein KNT65_gp145 [Escherichia phage EcS1]|uniref:Uncharacterized protein n=1 Tax=Escherichia phage EcS1 TaxID=2083276 RepID=A0A2Z5ZD29_9CAUD|nr:Hypothetical protein KNT65_gp145 [Escherichia phage EcS1]BBC78193.1 Hypothetical protein [Escherichia phage EcS1]
MAHYFRYNSFERTSFDKPDKISSALIGLLVWCLVLLILIMTLGIIGVSGQEFGKLFFAIGGYSLVIVEFLALFGYKPLGWIYFIPARLRNQKLKLQNQIEEAAAEANKTSLKIEMFIKECKVK